MKKLVMLLLCVISVFALVACNADPVTPCECSCSCQSEPAMDTATAEPVTLILTVIGNDDAFTAEKPLYYGNIGDTIVVKVVPSLDIVGYYVAYSCADAITKDARYVMQTEPITLDTVITIAFTVTEPVHNLVVSVWGLWENEEDIIWLFPL